MEWAIETQGLSKTYKEVEALKGLDLQVPQNSIFGFLGPNGAGKTTAIKLLLGLIRPTAGTATVFGHDIRRDSIAVRSRIGYLPQDPSFYEYMTARQILRYSAEFYFQGPRAEIERRVEETLELVGLADKADRPIKGFSGGERQRVGIGQAQVNYPDLLILDEPAASLDPLGRRDVLTVMERLRKYTTVFYCTHILDDVQRVSDTVAILSNGELVAHGPIEGLLAAGEGAEAVFEVTVRGTGNGVCDRLSAEPWVVGVQPWVGRDQARQRNGTATWAVSVTDAAIAEDRLLRLLLADETLVVSDFRRRSCDLEEVFVSIVEGGSG